MIETVLIALHITEKVLAKCGSFEELKVQNRPNEADAFSDCLN